MVCVVGIRFLAAALGLQTPNLGVFTDIKLIDGLDDTHTHLFFPNPSIMQKRKRLKRHTGMPSTYIAFAT